MRGRVGPLRVGVLLGAALLVAAAGTASAQPVAPTLQDLKGLAVAAPIVKVTDSTGREVKGKLTGVSEEGLILRIGDSTRIFDATQVRQVRVRQEDSLVNGAVFGAAIGGGLSSLIFLDNECWSDGGCYAYVAVQAAIGTFIGIGVDALLHGYRVVYPFGAPGARALTVAPLVSPRAQGVQVRLAF